jgi:hypothetical protein
MNCPTCHSPSPNLHPAVQHEGEVIGCDDPFHGEYRPREGESLADFSRRVYGRCPCMSSSHEDPKCSHHVPPSIELVEEIETGEEADLLYLILDKLQYDFCEDDDEVQGNWDIRRVDDIVTVEYLPYDVSPYPAQTVRYRIERLP